MFHIAYHHDCSFPENKISGESECVSALRFSGFNNCSLILFGGYKKEPIPMSSLNGYRLCVLASGSVMVEILNFFRLIIISCLHLGQNRGKFSNTVFSSNFIRVLPLQIGHNNHSFILKMLYYLTVLKVKSIVL